MLLRAAMEKVTALAYAKQQPAVTIMCNVLFKLNNLKKCSEFSIHAQGLRGAPGKSGKPGNKGQTVSIITQTQKCRNSKIMQIKGTPPDDLFTLNVQSFNSYILLSCLSLQLAFQEKRAIPYLFERLFLISWENNRDCHITMGGLEQCRFTKKNGASHVALHP